MKKIQFGIICILFVIFACNKKNNEQVNTDVNPRNTCELLNNTALNSSLLKFSIESFKTLEQEEADSVNIFYSPFSLSVVVTMLLNGSMGETMEIIKNSLKYGNTEIPIINTYLNDITNCMSGHDDINIKFANSLWINNDYPVNETYIDSLKKYYYSNVYNQDFSAPDIIQLLNSWVKENTDGNINDLFINNDIKPQDILILINAIYFSGNWKYSFNPEITVDSAFTIYNNTDIEIPYMQCNGLEFTYHYNTEFDAVRLPYGNESTAMYVFLPKETSNLDIFFSRLNEDNWNSWLNSFDSISEFIPEPQLQMTWFQIPKFKIEYSNYLNDLLKNLGMEEIFETPDFSGITDIPISVTNSKQKAYIEINENGTTATSSTFVSAGFGPTPYFLINRPFFFVIRDENTGVILFMGKLVNP